MPNLVVVSDDLFTSPFDWPDDVVWPQVRESMKAYPKVGGVFLVNRTTVPLHSERVLLRTKFLPNPRSSDTCRIPVSAIDLLARSLTLRESPGYREELIVSIESK